MEQKAAVKCILCGSRELIGTTILRPAALSRIYKDKLNIDITNYLSGIKKFEFVRCSKCDGRFFWPFVTINADFYESLQKTGWYYQKGKKEYEFAKQFLRPQDKVLEVGCGSGLFAEYSHHRNYTGLEFNPQAISDAREKGLNVFNASIEDFSINHPYTFDVICAFQVLEHIPDPKSFIASCRYCLKQGGILICSVPSADTFVPLIRNNFLNSPPHHVTWWSDICLRNLSRLFNLHLESIKHHKLEQFHYRLYSRTMANAIMNQILGRHIVLMDESHIGWMVDKLSVIWSLILQYGLRDTNLLPDGHTVTAIYKKPLETP